MEEVGIFAVSVAVAYNGFRDFGVLFVFILPGTSTVLRVCSLESSEELSVIIGNLSDFLDSVSPV